MSVAVSAKGKSQFHGGCLAQLSLLLSKLMMCFLAVLLAANNPSVGVPSTLKSKEFFHICMAYIGASILFVPLWAFVFYD